MASKIQQTVQILDLLIEYRRSLTYLRTTNRSNLKTLSTLVAMVDELHESIDYSFYRGQKAFLLQDVVERTSADVCPGYVRTDGIEVDVLFWQIFAVRTDEPYHTTEQASAFLAKSITNLKDGHLTALQPCTLGVLRKCQ
jgi:hypothetical protein